MFVKKFNIRFVLLVILIFSVLSFLFLLNNKTASKAATESFIFSSVTESSYNKIFTASDVDDETIVEFTGVNNSTFFNFQFDFEGKTNKIFTINFINISVASLNIDFVRNSDNCSATIDLTGTNYARSYHIDGFGIFTFSGIGSLNDRYPPNIPSYYSYATKEAVSTGENIGLIIFKNYGSNSEGWYKTFNALINSGKIDDEELRDLLILGVKKNVIHTIPAVIGKKATLKTKFKRSGYNVSFCVNKNGTGKTFPNNYTSTLSTKSGVLYEMEKAKAFILFCKWTKVKNSSNDETININGNSKTKTNSKTSITSGSNSSTTNQSSYGQNTSLQIKNLEKDILGQYKQTLTLLVVLFLVFGVGVVRLLVRKS